MKFKIELEIDWIDGYDDGGVDIDQVLKNEIAQNISKKVSQNVIKKIEKKVSENVDNEIFKIIGEKTDQLFNDFVNRPVVLTDKYGSKSRQYDKIEDIVKEKFDNFLTDRVDENGRSTDYGAKFTRIEFLIKNQISQFSEKFTTETVSKVKETVKEYVKEGLSLKLGNELMDVLKVDKMLGLNEKNK